jgi:hypothetical protein
MRTLFAGALLLFLLPCLLPQLSAQTPARPDIPEKLAAPSGEVIVLQARGSGFQVYVCKPGPDPDQKLAWMLKAPEADLLDPAGRVIGKHYAGPAWKHNDGSEVVGRVAARQDAPSPGDIPWLLLSPASHSGSGVLSRVTSIQRLQTKGGQPSQSGCDESHRGTESKIPYSATYLFYAPPSS